MRSLDVEEVKAFKARGYLFPLPALSAEEIETARDEIRELLTLRGEGPDPFGLKGWHMRRPGIYSLATHPQILAYLEALIGPNIMLWGNRIFCKFPGDEMEVAWHQDTHAWPLFPHKTVTVWLAVDDSNLSNGAMQVIPESHKLHHIKHGIAQDDQNLLDKGLNIPSGEFDVRSAVGIELKAGEISLHDANIIHGSGKNMSDHRRCGVTFRYCPPEVYVKDPDRWHDFRVTVVRGENTNSRNREFRPEW